MHAYNAASWSNPSLNDRDRHVSNTIIKFADATTAVVGLITDNNETAYREEVRDLAVRSQDNNLSLNVIKTKEMKRTEKGTVWCQEKEDRVRPHSHRQGCSGAG